VEATFRPFLDERAADQRCAVLTKLIVTTDVYVWKLLRRDIGLGRDQAERYVAEMVSAVVERQE
jgi:hypothetical protein